VNDIAWHRKTDHWEEHCCLDCHDSNLAEGSDTVFANDLEVARINDPVACGSLCLEGSPDTFAGD